MTAEGSFDCDVLIAGGGPTGATLAILLAKRGVKVIVAEKEAAIYPLPRAAHIDHECMRILQDAGVAEAVMASSRRAARYDFLNASGRLLLRFDGADQIGPGGWPVANMIHQPSVEAELRRVLAGLAHATLLTSSPVTGFTADADGVTARLGDRTIRARWLVGADGARSPVREASGITFDDLGFEEPWLVVDMLVDDASRLPTSNLQICNPQRPTTCVLMGEGRHRWEFMILPGENPDEVSSDASIARLLAPWNVEGAVRLERKAVYTFRARIARTWRQGRVLLAGDAAHQTPPFAGQGMCAGLRDAANLAWKLAAVVHGQGHARLLDSYQLEREPHVRATIGMAVMMGRMVCTTSRRAAFLRDMKFRLAHALGKLPDGPPAYPAIGTGAIMAGNAAAGRYFPQPVAADGQHLDTALGDGAWLIGEQPAGLALPPGISGARLDEARLAPWRAPLAAWLAEAGAEAALVRPDRHVFGAGNAAQLLAAWHASVSPAAAP